MRLEDAIALACVAHAGQMDQSGHPYIRHCLRVMERLAPYNERMIVGVLHDVLEDTDTAIRPDDLDYTEFQALQLLTRPHEMTYEDYIVRVMQTGPAGTLACHVKLADLADNLGRIEKLREPKRSMLRARYEAAQNAIARRLGVNVEAYR